MLVVLVCVLVMIYATRDKGMKETGFFPNCKLYMYTAENTDDTTADLVKLPSLSPTTRLPNVIFYSNGDPCQLNCVLAVRLYYR